MTSLIDIYGEVMRARGTSDEMCGPRRSGFLGSHLTDTLLAAGHEVRVFDRPNVMLAKTLTRATKLNGSRAIS